MVEARVRWTKLLEVANRYHEEAEICLSSGCYVAGLVCVRAALEAMLVARYLMELFDYPEEDLPPGVRVDIDADLIEVEEGRTYHRLLPYLKDLIDRAFTDGLLTKTGREAAHRIREWGNKIHPLRVVKLGRLPSISHRNLKARLKDLNYVMEQIVRTL